MIIKPLKTPVYTLQMEALNMRLPLGHLLKEDISSKARNLRAGYHGEQSLQFPLSFLPYEKYLIFYNLRLRDAQGFFQIDILLLSTHFILIIEVKNIRGQVHFNDMSQTIRIENGEEQVFNNPIDQVKLQFLRLQRWLKKIGTPIIPIEKVVVYSNSNTILKNLSNDKEPSEMVIPKGRLLKKIDDLSAKHQIVRLSEDQLMELSFQLLSEHTEDNTDILKKYKLSYNQLVKGVICPDCFKAPMLRKSGKWRCSYCAKSTKSAHLAALAEYALLIGKYINNRELRDFLQLDSIHIARQLLQKEKLDYFGSNSGRKYILQVDNLL